MGCSNTKDSYQPSQSNHAQKPIPQSDAPKSFEIRKKFEDTETGNIGKKEEPAQQNDLQDVEI